MRITNGMMVDQFLINMQNNQNKMSKYTAQLSSNRKIVKLSDDPVGVFSALTARQRLLRYEEYQSTLVKARNWSEQCEASLQEMSAKITTIKEEVINAATNIKNDGDRENIAVLMTELRNTVMDALNTTVGGEHVFAGYNTANKPLTFAADGSTVLYNGIDLTNSADPRIGVEQGQALKLEVGYGLQMEVTMNAIDVVGVGDNNLFKNINEIIDLMENPGARSSTEVVSQLSSKLEGLSASHERITSCLVRAGAMTTQIDILDDRYSQDVINYNEIRSKIEDIDSAETIMDWKMAEAVYKQSLSTGARVIMPTLMDFLR